MLGLYNKHLHLHLHLHFQLTFTVGRIETIQQLSDLAKKLTNRSFGHVVMVEGEVGVGKTHILRRVHEQQQAKISFLWSTGDSIQSGRRPFHLWKHIFTTLFFYLKSKTLEEYKSSSVGADEGIGDSSEEQMLTAKLGGGVKGDSGTINSSAQNPMMTATATTTTAAATAAAAAAAAQEQANKIRDYEVWITKFVHKRQPSLVHYLSCLNELMDTSFAQTRRTSNKLFKTFSTQDKLEKICEFSFLFMQEYMKFEGKPLILILDGCQFLSSNDWNLTQTFASYIKNKDQSVKNVACWISTRPLKNKKYGPKCNLPVPQGYFKRCEEIAHTTITLEPWNLHHTNEMLTMRFDGAAVDPELVNLVHERAGGIPLFW